MANMIIDFGKKYKGHQISECDEKYLKWLVAHEKVLAMRNRWASRDARFELQRRAEAAIEAVTTQRIEAAVNEGNANWDEWQGVIIACAASCKSVPRSP